MRIVTKGEFPGSGEDLQAAVAAFAAEVAAHQRTVGVPAPLPAYEVLAELAKIPADQWVFGEDLPPEEPSPEVITYRDRRAIAYRDQLGKERGNFIKTLGDVIDTIIAQTEATRAAAGADRTADFDAMIGKIAAIRKAIPKE